MTCEGHNMYKWPQLPLAVASYSYTLCSSYDFRTKRNTHKEERIQPFILASKMRVNTDDWISNNGRDSTFIFRESNALLQTHGCQEAPLHPSTSCDHSHIMPLACSFLSITRAQLSCPICIILLHNSRQEPRITLWKAWQSINKSILILHSHILSVFLDTIRLQYDYI